jgi:hypothetical protein
VRRLLFLGLVPAAALFAVALTPGAGPTPPRVTGPPAPPRSEPRLDADATPDAGPVRNIFEYVTPFEGRGPSTAPTTPRVSLVAPPLKAPETVRLVGLVARGASLRAALYIEGGVVLLSVGQQFRGYTLLSLDEDAGAQVLMPDGGEVRLSNDR